MDETWIQMDSISINMEILQRSTFFQLNRKDANWGYSNETNDSEAKNKIVMPEIANKLIG